MGLSYQDILAIIAKQRREYIAVHQSSSSPAHEKKYAIYALFILKKLEEEIKEKNDRSKTQGW